MSADVDSTGTDRVEIDWAGTYRFTAPVLRPASVAELQDLVRSHRHVRALGTRHTFNGLADSPGVLVDVARLDSGVDSGLGSAVDPAVDPAVEVDEAARTVTVGAGVQFGALARELDRRGWALHNLGSLPHICVGGAVATGTHGSGDGLGALATAVRALQYVDAGGELITARRGESDFAGKVVALGALGIVVRLTLDVQPTYQVRQDVYRGLPWTALDDWPAVTGAGYSVSVFTTWDADALGDAWVKSRPDSGADVPDELAGAARDPESRDQITPLIAGNVTPQGGSAGPWWSRLPHFRADTLPSNGDEMQSEYFVDRASAAAAIDAVRGAADRFRDHLIVSELRTVAADDLWLSGASGRDTAALHFTWRRTDEVRRTCVPAVEQALAGFGARPHWGKVHGYDAAALADVHPQLGRARALLDALDPGRTPSRSSSGEEKVRSAG